MAERMTSRDLREVNDASSYAVGRQEDMADLTSRVEDMGSLRLWWDSKVPENKKWFFNQISFKTSDPEAIKAEIARHKDFYSDMRMAMAQVRNGDEDAEDLIQELYDRLTEMQAESESKIGSTDSKTLMRLHKDFVEKHQLLENKIKRVEVVAVRQQLRRARDDWREAVNEIRDVKRKFEDTLQVNCDLTERFERLMMVNEQLVNQQQDLRDENRLIRNLLEDLVRKPEP